MPKKKAVPTISTIAQAQLEEKTLIAHASDNSSETAESAFVSPRNPLVGGSYQTARLNCFIEPRIRQQLDVLANEWGVPLVEVLRRLLYRGLGGILLDLSAQ